MFDRGHNRDLLLVAFTQRFLGRGQKIKQIQGFPSRVSVLQQVCVFATA
jgi:hypothetical protein